MAEDKVPARDDLQVTVNPARGPSQGSTGHSFCGTCKKAVFSLWRYGPVTPRVYNSSFCTCGGKWLGWDEAEIERNRQEAELIAEDLAERENAPPNESPSKIK